MLYHHGIIIMEFHCILHVTWCAAGNTQFLPIHSFLNESAISCRTANELFQIIQCSERNPAIYFFVCAIRQQCVEPLWEAPPLCMPRGNQRKRSSSSGYSTQEEQMQHSFSVGMFYIYIPFSGERTVPGERTVSSGFRTPVRQKRRFETIHLGFLTGSELSHPCAIAPTPWARPRVGSRAIPRVGPGLHPKLQRYDACFFRGVS